MGLRIEVRRFDKGVSWKTGGMIGKHALMMPRDGSTKLQRALSITL